MTANVTIPGPRAIVGSKPTDTNEATVYTAGKEFPVLVQLLICNGTGSAATATAKWGDGTTDYDMLNAYSVAAHSYVLLDVLIPLRENYTLKVTSGTGSALTYTFVIVSTGSTLGRPGSAAA